MNIAICEDNDIERAALESELRRYCGENAYTVNICSFSDASQLLAGWKPGEYQIMFLDIYMQGITGVELADTVRRSGDDCSIVFITVSRDHAVEGFNLNAAHYLVKPLTYKSLCGAMNRCVSSLGEDMKYIEVTSDRLQIKILNKDIRYIEIYNTTCLIHTVDSCVKTYATLDNIQKSLSGSAAFLRCHRSYIVNINYIDRIDGDVFIMNGGDRAPIRKSELRAVKQIYTDFLFDSVNKQDRGQI